MERPDLEPLGTFTRAICLALATRARNATPTQAVLDLIAEDTPDDVRALLWHLAHHAPAKVMDYPGWRFFGDWDHQFTQLSRSEHGVWLGTNAGGVPFVAAVKDGKTVILDGMDGLAEYCDSLESYWWQLLMQNDDAVDPVLAGFTPEGEPWEW